MISPRGPGKHSSRAKEKTEESDPQDGLPQPVTDEGDGGEGQRKPVSPLEMLFREAEIIAQNLKESGTRR
ncbi:MAG: hypothetical protein SVX38_10815 [Chloroflexota bacterium]|nr:hypothetical protein [Chloroflexota bacterium]